MDELTEEKLIDIAKDVNKELNVLWRKHNWKGTPPLVTVGVVELVVKHLPCPSVNIMRKGKNG